MSEHRIHLSPYVMIQDPVKKDAILILDTNTLAIGQIWMFRTDEEMQAFQQENKHRGIATMIDYRILVLFRGTIHSFIAAPEIAPTVIGMIAFYHQKFVEPNAPRYKKYFINPPDDIDSYL